MTITDRDIDLGLDTEALSERLTAMRAAVDPQRRTTRHNTLVNAIVETLARRGPLTIAAITQAVRVSWKTEAVTEPLVQSAVDTAYEAHLVSKRKDGKWALTDSAAIESKVDARYVEGLLSEFEQEIGRRLNDLADERVDASAAKRVATAVYAALACGAEGLYAVEPIACDSGRLRPAKFSQGAVRQYLMENLEPRSVRDAALEIAVAAIDPDDEFGNEVLRLVTVTSLMHGSLTRRDVPTKPDLSGYRLLLDTSVLLDLVDDGSPNQQVMRTILDMAKNLNVEVIVAEHTVDEWNRVLDAAAIQVTEAAVPDNVLTGTHRIAGNPFTRMYLQALEDNPRTNWARFEAKHRDVTRTLTGLGINVRPHGNNSAPDRQVADAVAAGLLDFSEENHVPGRRPLRKKNSAAADGESCAMVARWRSRPLGPESAYFVAAETLTNSVYSTLIGDPDALPVTITPASWAMFAANLTCEDPAEPARIAEMVADSAVRDMFFGMAAGCTLEEALSLSEQLSDDGETLSVEATREFVHAELLGILDEADNGDTTAARRGAAVSQQRNLRRQRQLSRQEGVIDLRVKEAERKAAARVAEAEAKVSAKDEKVASLLQQLDDKDRETEERAARDRRRSQAITGGVVLGLVFACLVVLGLVGWAGAAVALLGGVWLFAVVRTWVREGGSLESVVQTVLFEAVWLGLSSVF